MRFELVILGSLLYISLGTSIFFLYYSVRNRQKLGAKPLAVLFVGILLWIISDIIQLHTPADPTSTLGVVTRLLGPDIGVIGLLLFGLEYTGREDQIDRRLFAVLGIKPGVTVAVLLSPFRETLFANTGTTEIGYEFANVPYQIGHTLYDWAILLLGLGLLAHMLFRANYGHRRQIATILTAVAVPFLFNVLYHAGVLRQDVTSMSFFVTASIIMYATFQLRLMETIPLARQTVLEEMEDMVLVLDEQGRIVSVNSAVRATFGSNRQFEGETVADLFGTALPDGGTQGEMVSAETVIDGETRKIEINSSPLNDYRNDRLGQVLVCRDVTQREMREKQLRRREQELALLKDLQSRFLRHNLRNQLNVVQLHARELYDEDDPEQTEQYQSIIEKTDRILEWGTKARTIENLVETDERIEHDLERVIEMVLGELTQSYPDVSFETDIEPSLRIVAVPQVERALENVIDNAARHNTADDPRVEIGASQTENGVVVEISDNGPGVDTVEIETIQKQQEDSISHASGLGLWLVYWVLNKSGGELFFDTEDGTTVRLQFQSADADSLDSTLKESDER